MAPRLLQAADDGLLEAVRGLHLAHPELGPKPLLVKLREQQPDLAVGNKEVREALAALKAEESKQGPGSSPPRYINPLEIAWNCLILIFSIVGATFGTVGAIQELISLAHPADPAAGNTTAMA